MSAIIGLVNRSRPSLFVGSSTEGTRVAEALQVLLDRDCQVELWSQGVFELTRGNLESLVLALDRFDFAILVLSADDLVVRRGAEKLVARDNAIFELGLFIGRLGRERTFIVYDRTKPPDLPSDLAGVTAATFQLHETGNLVAALGAAATLIKSRIEAMGSFTRDASVTRQSVSRVERLVDRTIPDPTAPHVRKLYVQTPVFVPAPDAEALEREASFHAAITDIRVTEATSVRCRYDWNVHIINRAPRKRGFFGSVCFRDSTGYDVAKTDIAIDRPYRAPASGEETYTSFLYLAPEHAQLVQTVHLNLLPKELNGTEKPCAVTREWHGVQPR